MTYRDECLNVWVGCYCRRCSGRTVVCWLDNAAVHTFTALEAGRWMYDARFFKNVCVHQSFNYNYPGAMIKYLLVGRRLAGPRCHAHDYCVRARSLTPPGWWHIHLIWAPNAFCGTSFIINLFIGIYISRMWEQYANANGLGHHLQHCIKIRQAHPAHFSRM